LARGLALYGVGGVGAAERYARGKIGEEEHRRTLAVLEERR
jgi:hypothetical protein